MADSLCRLIEHADSGTVPLAFIDKCVDAIRAIIREHEQVNAERAALELAKGLRALANELIAARNGAKEPTAEG